MSITHLREQSQRETPQSEPLPGQVPNSAGGHSYEVGPFERLTRFLILGTEGGTFYASERKVTTENVAALDECLNQDAERTVQLIVDISTEGRSPKNDYAIFALARACAHADAKQYAFDAITDVCRTGTHLFHFCAFVEGQRGWGRGLRRAVARWYTTKSADQLAYQIVKYRQRDGWTHRDVLRLSHPTTSDPEIRRLFDYACGRYILTLEAGKDLPGGQRSLAPEVIVGYMEANTDGADVAAVVRERNIPREALPTSSLRDAKVWDALLNAGKYGMPMTAMVRNLGTMGSVGLLTPMSEAERVIVDRLEDSDAIEKSRIHPIQLMAASYVYRQGQGYRGSNTWTVAPNVAKALEHAFHASFGNIVPADKRTLIGLDVSASMTFGDIAGLPFIQPRDAAAAMAMVTARTEQRYAIMGFTSTFIDLNIMASDSLDDVLRKTSRLPHGGTDCSLPMTWALQHKVEVDTFIVYTDSETWAGRSHPAQALKTYRERTGIPSRLIVVGMEANQFSIADPNDPGMLDVVGFDTATPDIISRFSAGAL
jgi:60 kDa SS-A/Ro ribonucleoprotein